MDIIKVTDNNGDIIAIADGDKTITEQEYIEKYVGNNKAEIKSKKGEKISE